MKTSIKSLFALIAGVSLFAACEKQNVKEQPSLVNITITASQDTDTKTVLGENGQVNWSLSGEKLAVLQDNGTKISKKASSDGVSTDDGATMKFDVNFTAETAASFSYYAFYPDAAYLETPADVTKTKIQLTNNQKPTATSFGPASDILVAKPLTGLGEQPSNLDLQFARIVAVGKMAVKNLNSTENVSKITFTAAGKVVTGRSYVDLSSATVTEYGYSGQGLDNVVLDYTDQTIAANDMTAYFTCWPFELSAGDKFTVKVETESQAFTKEVTIPDGKSLAFNTGRASAFSVDFTGIEGENTNTSVALPYASLTFEEIKNVGSTSGDKSWGKYNQVFEYTQGNGASWLINAYYNGEYIQLAKAADKKSYIKLPDFANYIKTVKITLSTSTYNKTLALCSTSDATKGDIQEILGSGNQDVFEYDLTDKNVTTAYVITIGGACQGITSIEVTTECEDTRTQLATPSNIMADLVTGTPNSIEVVWDKVDGAGSYVVTATPATGDAVSETVTGTTYTFTGLEYETEYTISVIAKPADAAAYKDSEAGIADKVTTGANPNAGEATIVEISSFTAVNGTIDNVISYSTDKGGGTSAPAINGGEIRLYQNSAGTGGGYITITAKEGYTIKSATIGSSMATKVAYTLGADTNKSTSVSLAANGKYEVDGLSTSSISFHCMGTDKNSRLYVNYISVVYE